MELLKTVRKRSFLSETAYIILNIALAIALLVVVLAVNVPWPALALVFISKWRVFAVRSRYWGANIRANLIDFIVGASMVALLYAASGDIVTQIALTALYTSWLLFLKPRSKRKYVAAQAATGLVFGIAAITQISPNLPSSVVVIMAWIVGFSAARHVLSIQHETHINFLTIMWGFVVAELMWLTYHFTIGYPIGLSALAIAQVTIIIGVISFAAERLYMSYRHNGSIQSNEVMLPVLFSVSIVVVLIGIMLFNSKNIL